MAANEKYLTKRQDWGEMTLLIQSESYATTSFANFADHAWFAFEDGSRVPVSAWTNATEFWDILPLIKCATFDANYATDRDTFYPAGLFYNGNNHDSWYGSGYQDIFSFTKCFEDAGASKFIHFYGNCGRGDNQRPTYCVGVKYGN